MPFASSPWRGRCAVPSRRAPSLSRCARPSSAGAAEKGRALAWRTEGLDGAAAAPRSSPPSLGPAFGPCDLPRARAPGGLHDLRACARRTWAPARGHPAGSPCAHLHLRGTHPRPDRVWRGGEPHRFLCARGAARHRALSPGPALTSSCRSRLRMTAMFFSSLSWA